MNENDELYAKGVRVSAAALQRFGATVISSLSAYEQALVELAKREGIRVRDVEQLPAYKEAAAVATFLGLAFRDGAGYLEPGDAVTLSRLYQALWPHTDARTTWEAVAVAEGIVTQSCQLHAEMAARGEDASEVAIMLPFLLTAKAHPGFSPLRRSEREREKVAALVARWIPSTKRAAKERHKRRPKAGEASRLTSAGILCELNELAKFPLGRQLTASGVGSALDRAVRSRIGM